RYRSAIQSSAHARRSSRPSPHPALPTVVWPYAPTLPTLPRSARPTDRAATPRRAPTSPAYLPGAPTPAHPSESGGVSQHLPWSLVRLPLLVFRFKPRESVGLLAVLSLYHPRQFIYRPFHLQPCIINLVSVFVRIADHCLTPLPLSAYLLRRRCQLTVIPR